MCCMGFQGKLGEGEGNSKIAGIFGTGSRRGTFESSTGYCESEGDLQVMNKYRVEATTIEVVAYWHLKIILLGSQFPLVFTVYLCLQAILALC
jgi:hypothetical protein